MDILNISHSLHVIGAPHYLTHNTAIVLFSSKSIIWFWFPWLFFILLIRTCINRVRHQYEVIAANGIPVDRGGLSPSTLLLGPLPKYRFRKRDKIAFYGKKMLRKMNEDSGSNGSTTPVKGPSENTGLGLRRLSTRLKDQPWIAGKKIARYLAGEKKKIPKVSRPREQYSEAFLNFREGPITNPPIGYDRNIWYLIRNVRIFNQSSNQNIITCMCKEYLDPTLHVAQGKYLFEPGVIDDSIYVVVKGLLSVSIRDDDGKEHEIKKVGPGENVFSLLSILDVMARRDGVFKTVSAKALEDSDVLRLHAQGFAELFDEKPEVWIRTVRVIVIKLMHVTLTTLHNYMGLSSELFKLRLREPRRQRDPSGTRAQRDERERFCSGDTVRSDGSNKESDPVTPSDPVTSSTPTGVTFDFTSEKMGKTHYYSTFNNNTRKNLSEEKERWNILAKKTLSEAFGLPNDLTCTLDDKFTVENYPPGFCLLEQGSTDGHLFFVLKGQLQLEQATGGKGTSMPNSSELLAVVHSHECCGGLSTLSSEPSFYTVRARHESWVAKVTKNDFFKVVEDYPRAILNLSHFVIQRLSPFIRAIDFALDWELRDSGQALYIQETPGDSLYVVLSGRLRSVMNITPGGGQKHSKQMVEEFGRGDLIGLLEVLTRKPYTTDVVAIRYSELAKLPEGLISYIKQQFPQVMARIVILLGDLISNYHQKIIGPNLGDNLATVRNLSTIAVVAADGDVPLTAFTLELWQAINAIKPALRLTYDVIVEKLGTDETEVDRQSDLRMLHWLNMQEDAFGAVIYQCDRTKTRWTERCLRQADCVLVVAMGEAGGSTPLNQLLVVDGELGRAQKELVLLWKDNQRPRRTGEWLDSRSFVSGHYHFKTLNRMFKKSDDNPKLVEDFYERNVFPLAVDRMLDSSRLARVLTGTSVGLVLSGGGARGAAHVGIIQALLKYGIPIDSVGGVSIGSMVGGLYCDETDISCLIRRARSWFMEMSNTWKNLFDLTYHHSAIFTGASFNSTLKNLFQRRQIEDLWLPFFCISTDISSSEMRVHRTGSVWCYVRASMSYCGPLPPICDPLDGNLLVDGCYINNCPGSLWKYCRSSMSLAGYLPPLCDPHDGHYLLDGGYVNNMPADVMRASGARYVIAVDVGAEDENDLTNYGESLSGLWVLWHKFWPWASKIRILNMEEIQSRLAYVSCVRQMEQVKKAPYCLYMRPPIAGVHTLDFAKFDAVSESGCSYAKPLIEEWMRFNGKLFEVFRPCHVNQRNENTNVQIQRSRSSHASANSFTRSSTVCALNDLTASLVAATKPAHLSLDEQISESDESSGESSETELDGNFLMGLATPGRGNTPRGPSPFAPGLLHSLSEQHSNIIDRISPVKTPIMSLSDTDPDTDADADADANSLPETLPNVNLNNRMDSD